MAMTAERYAAWVPEVRAAVEAYVRASWPRDRQTGKAVPPTVTSDEAVRAPNTVEKDVSYQGLLDALLVEADPNGG